MGSHFFNCRMKRKTLPSHNVYALEKLRKATSFLSTCLSVHPSFFSLSLSLSLSLRVEKFGSRRTEFVKFKRKFLTEICQQNSSSIKIGQT